MPWQRPESITELPAGRSTPGASWRPTSIRVTSGRGAADRAFRSEVPEAGCRKADGLLGKHRASMTRRRRTADQAARCCRVLHARLARQIMKPSGRTCPRLIAKVGVSHVYACAREQPSCRGQFDLLLHAARLVPLDLTSPAGRAFAVSAGPGSDVLTQQVAA